MSGLVIKGNENNIEKNHTFAICAYKESPYLEECIKSLLSQTIKSQIILCTSTPNEYIKSVADQYDIEYFINNEQLGIGADWNFAYSKANTPFVTIAHQDDIYLPTYKEEIMQKANKYNDSIIIYTAYKERREDKSIENNRLLQIKKLMNAPLKMSIFQDIKWVRKLILAFGCPICCPSVTLNKNKISGLPFNISMKNSLDWEAWIRLGEIKGRYIYISNMLMEHRISAVSETTKSIANGVRQKEDMDMLYKYWPPVIAKLIMKFYSRSMKSNEM